MSTEEQLRALFDAFMAAKKEQSNAKGQLIRAESELANKNLAMETADKKFAETKKALDEALGNETLEPTP